MKLGGNAKHEPGYLEDEANLNIPQSPEARMEIYELGATEKLLSGTDGRPSIAIVQDSLLAAHKMTRGLVKISRAEFFNICMKGDELEGQTVGVIKGWDAQRVLDKLGHVRKTLLKKKKAPVAFSGRGLISLMLPEGFSYKFENGADPEDPVVKISDGVYISGSLDKKVLGASPFSLIKILEKEYGPRVAINFVDNMQFITNAWMACEGFSIGLQDAIASKRQEVESIVKEAFFEAENIAETTILPGIREMRISACLGNARNEGMRVAQNALRKDNNFIPTVTSGSKGDWPNLMQITACLGQQLLGGARIRPRLNHGKRAMSHYRWEKLSVEEEYESRGFVTSSFMKGLSPREFINHAYGAREGIVHTAISTSQSGYNQRKIAHTCEDLQVRYDGTVRNVAGTVFQLAYAGDGFSREKMVKVGGELLPIDIPRLLKRLNLEARKSGERRKREITPEEIDGLLDFIEPRKGAPKEFALGLVRKHKEMMGRHLPGKKIFPGILPDLKERIEKEYFASLIQAGKNVGIQAAQNIGKEQTQTALDAFHRVGARENFLVDGSSRFSELLSMSKEPKVVISYIHPKRGGESIASLREIIGDSLVELTFKKIMAGWQIYKNKGDVLERVPGAKNWYPQFEAIHFAVPEDRSCIVYNLSKNMLFQFKVDVHDVAEKIRCAIPEAICVEGPINLAQLHVYFDVPAPPVDEEEATEDSMYHYIAESSGGLVEPMRLGGIKGIEEMFYLQGKDGKWMVETKGSNLMELLAQKEVDATRTISNNVWDIYKIFGIEAAREFLIEEFSKIMAEINLCDIKLLVDTMTYSGTLSSISRHAMKRDQAGSLAKAGFEETLDNFCKAGLYGETDNLRGISASIICGKMPKVGTGAFDLLYDFGATPN